MLRAFHQYVCDGTKFTFTLRVIDFLVLFFNDNDLRGLGQLRFGGKPFTCVYDFLVVGEDKSML